MHYLIMDREVPIERSVCVEKTVQFDLIVSVGRLIGMSNIYSSGENFSHGSPHSLQPKLFLNTNTARNLRPTASARPLELLAT